MSAEETERRWNQFFYYMNNPDEWYESKSLIHEEELEEGNKIRILEDEHIVIETDEVFWHGIQIQRVSKSQTGKWRYRERINIPYDRFPDFCEILLKVKRKCSHLGKER